jgi:Flp pilus assembly pilin Flp
MWIGIVSSSLRALAVQLRRDDGQTLAEYGIVVTVIAVIVIVAALLFGNQVSELFAGSARKV